MLLEHTSYRDYLKSVLADRQRRNPAYSMRAFADFLELTQPAISQIFSGKKNLSLRTAMRIAARLELNEVETEYLSLLVQLETAKDPVYRESLSSKLSRLNPKREVHELSVDLFRTISDWYHLVIRNMADLDEFEITPKSVARRLGISILEAETAIDRLVRLELLERNSSGRYVKTKGYVLVQSGLPSEALRNFNRQMLEKAIESLTTQTPEQKIVGSETFAIGHHDLEEARVITEDFFQKMAALGKKPGRKTEVYHLNVLFFNVSNRNAALKRGV